MLEKLVIYCKDLLTFPEERIIIGRLNIEIQKKSEDWITVDYMTSTPIGKSMDFDGEAETMAHGVLTKWSASITFTGTNALYHIRRLEALVNSELSTTLQKQLAIRVNHFSNIKNMKWLTGKTWDENYTGDIIIHGFENTIIPTKRIDIAQTEIIERA